jgi:hypothetical protein
MCFSPCFIRLLVLSPCSHEYQTVEKRVKESTRERNANTLLPTRLSGRFGRTFKSRNRSEKMPRRRFRVVKRLNFFTPKRSTVWIIQMGQGRTSTRTSRLLSTSMTGFLSSDYEYAFDPVHEITDFTSFTGNPSIEINRARICMQQHVFFATSDYWFCQSCPYTIL